MKKIFISIVAIAALAACTKSEVAYEQAPEISFAPIAKNVTKGAMNNIAYPIDQPIGIFANYGLVEPETPISEANVNSFSTVFLQDATFTYKTVGSVSAWGGGYSWPNNGSLIFAGYSMPTTGTVGTSREYNFSSDALTINGYTQSLNTAETFDLGWFGRTAKSFNYRSSGQAVDVVLSHALSWIEIRAYGEGTTVTEGNPWIITSIVMNNVSNTGNVTCTGSGAGKATWSSLGDATGDITIFTGEEELTTDPETVYENNEAGTVVIPQAPTAVNATNPEDEVATLTIKYKYKSPASTEEDVIWMPEQTATVSLKLDDAANADHADGWKSGYKYTYTLLFKSMEILVSPKYGTWEEVNESVTVE